MNLNQTTALNDAMKGLKTGGLSTEPFLSMHHLKIALQKYFDKVRASQIQAAEDCGAELNQVGQYVIPQPEFKKLDSPELQMILQKEFKDKQKNFVEKWQLASKDEFELKEKNFIPLEEFRKWVGEIDEDKVFTLSQYLLKPGSTPKPEAKLKKLK